MQRLSGLDASFLYLETASQPLHVCSILELDTSTMPGGYTFDRFRDAFSLRIKAMPQFREKLADSKFNLDHPVWVEDKDFDVDQWHGTNAFIRHDGHIYRTYFVDARGDEQMGGTWNYLDITALGRQETWEDSPEGYPQTAPYSWWRWHDTYGDAAPTK